jgi:N-acetylglucosaminyldiphosphoundecaprenol N-acetyl-beta-D-mannosaminyltransferase
VQDPSRQKGRPVLGTAAFDVSGDFDVQFQFGSAVMTVNIPDPETLMAALDQRFRAGQGFALATINLDHIVKLHRLPDYHSAYAKHEMICADGNPIVWLSRLARRPVQLVQGSDMIRPMLTVAARAGRSVAMVGSTEETLAASADQLMREIPGLVVVMRHAPQMDFDPRGEEARRVLAELAARDVGLCLVALGSPKQEHFAALGRELAPNVGFASIGAGLDFISGRQTRAPRWVRAIAMEWLWRAISAPRRLVPRYVACAAILPGEALKAWRLRDTAR